MGTEIIIAICALVIAFVTSIVSIYQSYLNRKQFDLNREQSILNREHNRLSVKPNLTVWGLEDNLNQYGNKPGTHAIIRIGVKNNGHGPAVIKDYTVLHDEDELGSNNNIRALRVAIQNKLNTLPTKCEGGINCFGNNTSIAAGASETLIEIRIPIEKNFKPNLYTKIMYKFHFVFKYESMYGEKFERNTLKDRLKANADIAVVE